MKSAFASALAFVGFVTSFSCGRGCASLGRANISGAHAFDAKGAVGSLEANRATFTISEGELRCGSRIPPSQAVLVGNIVAASGLREGVYPIDRHDPPSASQTMAFVVNRESAGSPFQPYRATAGELEIVQVSPSTMKVGIAMVFDDGRRLTGSVVVLLCDGGIGGAAGEPHP